MGTISNDFITIEYNSEAGRKTAEYYIKLFDKEPEYYKGLLNGIKNIHASKMPLPIGLDNQNRTTIIQYILGINEAKCTLFCSSIPTQKGVYYGIMTYISEERSKLKEAEVELIYHELAYDYLRMTGDFKYLKKYHYGVPLDSDIKDLIEYKIKNDYDTLLKEKIEDVKTRPMYAPIEENISELYKAIEYNDKIADKIVEESKSNNRMVKVPKIGKRKFEELVIGALAHIDPTNKMAEEYLRIKALGKVNLIYGKRNKSSEYYEERDQFGNITDYHLDIYMSGNINDVISLVHEFGHYYYRVFDAKIRKRNELYAEFPSIYFELKTLEYLRQVGYTYRQVNTTCAIRMMGNDEIISRLLPSLYCIQENMDKEEYHLDEVKNYVEKFIPKKYIKTLEISTLPRIKKKITDRIVYMNKINSLSRYEEDETSLKYLIGTYFAMHSINNLKNEDVLEILEYMRQKSLSFTEMKILLGMITPSTQGMCAEMKLVRKKQV